MAGQAAPRSPSRSSSLAGRGYPEGRRRSRVSADIVVWNTHDVTDLETELEEVGERVFERDTDITIHLPADDASAVRANARSRGVGASKLLREWVLDRRRAT
jgi:hypothetical protein